MKKQCLKLYEKAKNQPKGLRFQELQALCKCAGMTLSRISGSHYIYTRSNTYAIFNIQDDNGKAIPYQVRQVIDYIEQNNLAKLE